MLNYTRSTMCINFYFSENATWIGYWTWGVGMVRSSWLMSYAFLYTTYLIMLNYKFTYIFEFLSTYNFKC